MKDFEPFVHVLDAYARNLDQRTPEKFATEVFTPDADVETGFGLLVGIGEIVARYSAELTKFTATAHMNSNYSVEVDGDSARSSNYVIFWYWLSAAAGAVQQNGASLTSHGVYTGTYQDRWVRRPEGWRIAFRRFNIFGPQA